MNQTSTRPRATRMQGSDRLIDITGDAIDARSARHDAARDREHGEHRELGRLGAPGSARDTRHILEVRALLFAHGLDERGRRLQLAADSMTDEERRPHHIVAERQGAQQRPDEFAAIYRIADCFDDDLPNVSAVRPLTHKVRVATSDDSTMSKAGAPRFTPREAPSHLRAVPNVRHERPVEQRTNLAPTASVANPQRISGSSKSSQQMIANRHHDAIGTASGLNAIGALALARAVPAESKPEPKVTPRTPLRAVVASPQRSGSYGVVAFWLMFVIAFLFVAVVMHAGIARQQMTLDEINVSLEPDHHRCAGTSTAGQGFTRSTFVNTKLHLGAAHNLQKAHVNAPSKGGLLLHQRAQAGHGSGVCVIHQKHSVGVSHADQRHRNR